MAILRFDLIFSYWVYLWYILYVYKFTDYSPKLALIFGVIDNIIMLLLMFYFGSNWTTIVIFIIINTFIKVIPLYYLMREQIQLKDIQFTCILFIIFIIWLHINNQSLTGNIKLIHDSLLYNKNKTPVMQLFTKIKQNFEDLQIL